MKKVSVTWAGLVHLCKTTTLEHHFISILFYFSEKFFFPKIIMESILNSGLPHISEKIFKCLDNISLSNIGLVCRSLNRDLKIFIEDMLVTTKFYQKYNQIANTQWNFIIQSLIKGWQRYSLIL